jgi:hypothetical protein
MISSPGVVEEGMISPVESLEFVSLVVDLQSGFQTGNPSADELAFPSVDSQNRDARIGNLVQRRGTAVKRYSCLNLRIANRQQLSDAASEVEPHDAHPLLANEILGLHESNSGIGISDDLVSLNLSQSPPYVVGTGEGSRPSLP